MDDCISYAEISYFSQFIKDYLAQKDQLKTFYHRFPTLDNFKPQLEEKQKNYPEKYRAVLVSSLQEQYKDIAISEATQENITALQNNKTYTVTTGHQLNLATGPLYFLYKIIAAINLSKQLQETYPEYHFVPVYWMATEDHDFEEINHFHTENNTYSWQRKASGAVGELSTEGLEELFTDFAKDVKNSTQGDALIKLLKQAYAQHNNLADATRYLVNKLFGEYGLLIIDANSTSLKKLFIPYIEEELLKQTAIQQITSTTEVLQENGYKAQVTPRAINLFYLKDNLRERIVLEEGRYNVLETNVSFSKEEIISELYAHPERFSPNVIMRPLYQETILPNLCYIGGGGELAYWLQLKDYFATQQISFPILLLRNSALLLTEKQADKLTNLLATPADIFLPLPTLLTKKTKALSEVEIDFSKQKKHLQQQFNDLYKLAEQTDKSFLGAVSAQEKKQINGLAQLEKRLIKAQKRKYKKELASVNILHEALFPNKQLQERRLNFSVFYQVYGDELIQKLQEHLNPLDLQFTIITLPN
ncbi:bacillithiol biosynthesis cysteine-adding enzyme BshC [Mesonia hippocampi]|uniref:Putative cysteine ligase BshC n=1 Tax=Mesonia hippocampi TaxID=1628250 RepID=A0A840EPY5_9FLAO|nr:bacillithiol biosynthesis cysteine-adding enzyme BshC [Mesonia hippocampi]MBB4119121.1 bacillithiol biosynthesis cysteine-adding enzyme BshC [Mesonia hippocampi]